MKTKCRAIKNSGEQCTNNAKSEYAFEYCGLHKHLFKAKDATENFTQPIKKKKRPLKRDVIILLVGSVIGAILTIVVSEYYFRKSGEQSKEQFEEQSKDIKTAFEDKVVIEETPDAFSLVTWDIFENIEVSDRKKHIDRLFSLSNNDPKVRDEVCKFFCEYIRKTTSREDYQKKYNKQPSEEIQYIINLLFVKTITKRYIKDNQSVSSSIYIFDSCGKDLTKAFLYGTDFNFAKLSNVNFTNAKLNEVKFWNAELTNAYFGSRFYYPIKYDDNTQLRNVDFNNAKLDSVNFEIAQFSTVSFLNATLNNICFTRAKLNAVDFNDAKLREVDFYDAILSEINFKGTSLEKYHYNEITKQGRSRELTSTTEQISDALSGVQINGVRWATRNVDTRGKFADKPEDVGNRYQWNRLVVQTETYFKNGRATYIPGYSPNYSWTENYDPSPAGWRVPTINEIESLLDTSKVSNKWTTFNNVKGRIFTDKTNDNSIFLPAVGYRDPNRDINRDPPEGKLYNRGESGYYWSSASDGNTVYARNLYFNGNYAVTNTSHRGNCLSVRSVAKLFFTNLQILSLAANSTLFQNKIGSFTATLKNNENTAYNSRLWFYLEKPDNKKNPQQCRVGKGEVFSIDPGETKTINITDTIILPPDTYNCNMVFDVNNNPGNMALYQFSNKQNPLGVQVTIHKP